MTKKIFIITIGALTLFTIAGTLYYIFQATQPKPSKKDVESMKQIEKPVATLPEEPEIDTSGWKAYRNEKYGFEVKYPPEFFIKEIINPTEAQLLLVSIMRKLDDQNDSGIGIEVARNLYVIEKWEKPNTTVAGIPAIESYGKDSIVGHEIFTTIWLHDGLQYVISVRGSEPLDKDFLEVYREILRSFRYIR